LTQDVSFLVNDSFASLKPMQFSKRAEDMTIELFAAPKPFVGDDRESNIRAIQSWLQLRPKPKVTLLGYEVGYDEVAAEFGLNVERRVDKNFLGVPLFNSMFMRANESKATVTMIVNGDIILTDKLIHTLKRTVSKFDHFLLVSARFDVDSIPKISSNDPKFSQTIAEHALSEGTLHTYGGMDLWAWNTNGPRLFDPVMPHFVFGRGKYDNWLTHETIAAGRREVIDGSEACVMVHVKHDYHLVEGSKNMTPARKLLGQFWSEGKKTKFEQFLNIYMSMTTGSYTNQRGTVLSAPWKLSSCLEEQEICLVKRKRPGICNCEYSAFVARTQTDPEVGTGSRVIRCGMVSKETKEDFAIQAKPSGQDPSVFGLPLTLEPLLERLALNETIVLTALNYGYREMMMSWVCNLRHLDIANFVVAALDEELYAWAVVRGVPVYLENSFSMKMNSSMLAEAVYGTDSFKQLTKMKSRIALRILKLGYNVIWSDSDIVWFKNPVPRLHSYNADLIIQSNAPDNEALNNVRRINSGFYLARSNGPTIAAFEDVVEYAKRSRMSEQPCFYDVLCGKDRSNVVGKERCEYNEMTVQFLERELFPNGITHNIWTLPSGYILKRHPDLFILHNNWIKGAEEKRNRLLEHHYHFFDEAEGLCMYPTAF